MEEVRELQAWRHHRWRITCRDKFLADGDACTGYFFRRFKRRRAKTTITKIKTAEGVWLEKPQEVRKELQDNFSLLFCPHEATEDYHKARDLVLSDTNQRITQEQAALLVEVPSDSEIFESLLLLPSGKSPGIDGMGPEVLRSLWPVHLGFPMQFIMAVRALQEDAESRILLNGQMLSPFRVSKGVRQGCPLSPLLYVLASIPVINALKKENARGQIAPVDLGQNISASCICLADDPAVFTEVDKASVHDLINLLNLVEVVSGGKINKFKSKVFLIGSGRKPPPWLREVGIRLVGSRDVTTYLGAQLTTVWGGVKNGTALLEKLRAKAEHYTPTLLPFESRMLVLKHALFPTLIYQLLVTRFKKNTFRQADKVLREFLWSTDSHGKCKKSLAAWEYLTMPVKWRGAGIFAAEQFQVGLICRSLLKALHDPVSSLWGPILAWCFLASEVGELGQALFVRGFQSSVNGCPVVSLLLSSWKQFVSLFFWSPDPANGRPWGLLEDCEDSSHAF
ncbi:hypothetical protein R1sor_009071 [Riccia sorocarpa]|uniref:Reverse transcriptase domain-containing protein n=1 Tax=Riccia sorocarpa TaxID=122646 RepID=A0ABD3H7H3_9MARC